MTETVKELLDRLEQELSTKIVTLRREVAPLERELADVRRAKQAISKRESADADSTYPYRIKVRETTLRRVKDVDAEYRKKTMKQLALEALQEHFLNGATANQLLEFFASAWGRNDIARESFSPQLSRLKVKGKVRYDGKRWHLIPEEERRTPSEGQSESGPEIEAPANESAGASEAVGENSPEKQLSGSEPPQTPGRDPG